MHITHQVLVFLNTVELGYSDHSQCDTSVGITHFTVPINSSKDMGFSALLSMAHVRVSTLDITKLPNIHSNIIF